MAALEFDPDRWLDHRAQLLLQNPSMFLPFNAGQYRVNSSLNRYTHQTDVSCSGPRICLGQQFAYNESSFVMIKLFQRFSNVELALDAQPVDSLPPASWRAMKPGEPRWRQDKEKIMPTIHLTSYIKVRK